MDAIVKQIGLKNNCEYGFPFLNIIIITAEQWIIKLTILMSAVSRNDTLKVTVGWKADSWIDTVYLL